MSRGTEVVCYNLDFAHAFDLAYKTIGCQLCWEFKTKHQAGT